MSPAARASGAGLAPEDLLFKGYGNIGPGQVGMFKLVNPRQEPCACGGQIVDERRGSIQKLVEEHNETARHRAWRTWRETD